MSSRRLEDRIRDLCYRVVSSNDGNFASIISDLRMALHEHNQRLRMLAGAKLTSRLPSKKQAA